MDDSQLRRFRRLLAYQDGVVARRQVADIGLTPGDLERLLRRRDLSRVLPGVFVDHTGVMTWTQRAWVGCLALWPAVLDRRSALRAFAGPGWRGRADTAPIELAVDKKRTVATPVGYRVRRVAGLEARAQWNLSPPRMRIEEAAIDSAAAAGTTLAGVHQLAEVCQSRRSTAQRMLAALESRTRVPGREWLVGVLSDIADGTCSVLEHGYLTEVERPHGLPKPRRQAVGTGVLGDRFHDVDYPAYGVRIELDGRLFHDNPGQRDRDLDRDLDTVVEERRTARLGWGQVFDRPCPTAHRIGELLRQGGWTGRVQPCDNCRVSAA